MGNSFTPSSAGKTRTRFPSSPSGTARWFSMCAGECCTTSKTPRTLFRRRSLFARKAASVRHTPALASFLYGVAYRAALTLKRSAARRRTHEKRAQPLSPANPPTDLACEVEALLEEEIQRLPEKYRTAFVLCCLENQCRAEVARVLGIKEGTVSSRLDQARKILQRRLARRGVFLSAVLAAEALSQPSGATIATMVPPALLIGTTRAAAEFGAGKEPAAGVVSLKVAGLVAEVLRKSTATRLIITTALTLTLGVVAGLASFIGARPRPALQLHVHLHQLVTTASASPNRSGRANPPMS